MQELFQLLAIFRILEQNNSYAYAVNKLSWLQNKLHFHKSDVLLGLTTPNSAKFS